MNKRKITFKLNNCSLGDYSIIEVKGNHKENEMKNLL